MHKEHFCTTETPQKITEISRKYHGKSRKITENHGKSQKITEGFFQANHGNSRIPDAAMAMHAMCPGRVSGSGCGQLATITPVVSRRR